MIMDQSSLSVRNLTIPKEKLQAQAERVGRADHPTYSLDVFLYRFLRKAHPAKRT